MNKIINQFGEQILAVGQDNSHIRNKDVYCKTIPALIQRIRNSNAWISVLDTDLNRDLRWICEDDNIPKEKWGMLINTAWHYADNYQFTWEY